MYAFVLTITIMRALSIVLRFFGICRGEYPKTEKTTLAEAMILFAVAIGFCIWGCFLLFSFKS